MQTLNKNTEDLLKSPFFTFLFDFVKASGEAKQPHTVLVLQFAESLPAENVTDNNENMKRNHNIQQ